MTARKIQILLASVFFILGGWCLISPSNVMRLSFTPAYHSDLPIVSFAIACFGAQAMIAGLFAAFARFTRMTFLAYGLALIPFFFFDWYFSVVVPMFTWVGLLDAVGNVVMLGLCVVGWRALGKDAQRQTQVSPSSPVAADLKPAAPSAPRPAPAVRPRSP